MRRFTQTPYGARGVGIAQRAGSNLQDARRRVLSNLPSKTEPAAFRDRPWVYHCNYVSAVTHWKIRGRNDRGCKDLHLSARLGAPFRDPAILGLAPGLLSAGKSQVATFTHVHCGRRARCRQPREDAAACWRAWISMYTLISDTAAGVTPGMRLAWPRVRGRTRVSFSFISRDRPLTLA